MIINIRPALDSLFLAASTAYQAGFTLADPKWAEVAMSMPSNSESNLYPWLGVAPAMREWLGDRHIKGLRAHSYTLVNRKFESTVSVDRDTIEDDQSGTLMPVFAKMGEAAALHKDELVFGLINTARVDLCYDGLPMFSAVHPGDLGVQSNLDSGGAGPYWYLATLNGPIKPFILQTRKEAVFTQLTSETDANVFERDEYLYGIKSRMNAGFGLWQQAFASNQTLNEANFEAAWNAMLAFVTDEGQPLKTKPTHLVVPANLEFTAEKLIRDSFRANGGVISDNLHQNRVQIVSSQHLDFT